MFNNERHAHSSVIVTPIGALIAYISFIGLVLVFKDNCAIQIRVIRNIDNTNTDDKIAIKYDEMEDNYTVTYLDGTLKSATIQTLTMDGNSLDQYLKSLFTLLSTDDDPYKNIQFNIPAMPVVLYRASDLGNTEIVNALMTMMPLTNNVSLVR